MFELGINIRHCEACSSISNFEVRGAYPDGSQRLICAGCNKNGGVLHKCDSRNPFTSPEWLPLLMIGINIVCPKCKAAYDLGLKVEPVFPDLGKFLEAAGIAIGTALLIVMAVDIGQGLKRTLGS